MRTAAIAITGATGRLGGRVAARLAAAGAEMTLLVRDPGRAPALDGTEVRQASYGAEAGAALAGTETLFMVSGAEAADRVDQHRAFIDAAVAAGVRHVVYTSFLAAAPDSTFTLGRDHWATELAQTIGEATGRPFSYHDESLAEAYASRAAYGAPDWMVEAWVSTYTAIAAGEMVAVTDDVPRITGHPATSLRRLLTARSAG